MGDRIHIANGSVHEAEGDVFDEYAPPFDLESDMLFTAAAVPTADLGRHFPAPRFLEVAGRTPLIVWFSRVRTLVHGRPGERSRLDHATGFGYDELTIAALVRPVRFFVPAIYATGGLTQRVGRRYGMPKRFAPMTFAAGDEGVAATATVGGARTGVRAQLLASGRILGKAVGAPAPWWTWPAGFPSGSFIRARIMSVPRAQLAHVSGALALDEPWLAEPAPLWPLGVFVPGLVMRLPGPGG